jgi:hypothetical protein
MFFKKRQLLFIYTGVQSQKNSFTFEVQDSSLYERSRFVSYVDEHVGLGAGTRKPEFFPSADGLGQPPRADTYSTPYISCRD